LGGQIFAAKDMAQVITSHLCADAANQRGFMGNIGLSAVADRSSHWSFKASNELDSSDVEIGF
jgi:hypothetical protein